MSVIRTFEGWTILEAAHLTPQYDQNFVVYTNLNRLGNGINCKIQLVDLAQSDVRGYLSGGGMCRVIVRGTMCVAPTTEQGWSPRSNSYLHVTWIMQERQTELHGSEDIITNHEGRQTQQLQSNTLSTTTRASTNDVDSEDITEEKEPQSQDEDDSDSDPNYSSVDLEEEERTRRNDTDFDDSNDPKNDDNDDDDDNISSEEVENLKASADEPLPLQETKKQDDEDEINKK